ncbi:RNA polymerase II-associated protein 1 isoform X2 [Zootermopsis nevadensis]|uniref:RNA polymerase II-associated protein 1 isoform X2 n=1 Tax=Zootermopsis nevadensis TaxID=136037 RepID=UPI000B8E828F|nr:RNA polymerase II-associated protein 1 isoform X2 [Zootermopsis nevadensis]
MNQFLYFFIVGKPQDASCKKPRSKFASSRAESRSSKKGNTRNVVGPDVLGEIKEKNMTPKFAPPPSALSQQGFPQPFERDEKIVAKGKSIFAQQIEKMKASGPSKEMILDTHEPHQQADIENANHRFGDRSLILTGPDAATIHQENVERLSKMSAEEILQEQQKLASELDTKLLLFIRSRRKGKERSGMVDQTVKRPSDISELNPEVSSYVKMDTDLPCGNEPGVSLMGDGEDLPLQCVDITSAIQSEDRVQVSAVAVESENEKQTQSKSLENNNTSCQVDVEIGSVAVDLAAKSIEANRWLHMDIIEHEKLHWIGDIPPATAAPADAPYSARFDFQGFLLPFADDKVNVTQALHHHGEEPERPGYTLQELLKLSRSSLQQQRVLALTTLANILDKTKAGYYDECILTPLLNQLMDSDLYLLFRFSLDDNTETMVSATLLALRNLLWNHPDELCLDCLLGLWNGQRQPSLMVTNVVMKPSDKAEQEEEEAELKDHQILRMDMVKGALRTDLILRLRYILEVLHPGPKAVINVLEILTRIVRHSHDSALAVTCCPRLVSVIITNFVPRDWRGLVGSCKPMEMSSVYGIPLVEALKLLRVIASCTRSMASDLVHKYGVMDSVVSYISIDPRECGLPQQEAVRLSLESFYLWETLLAYNFASKHFIDLYPVLMRLLQFHLSATSASDSSSKFGHEHGAAVMSLLKEAMLASDTQMKRSAEQTVANIAQRAVVTIYYEHLSGFNQFLHLCLKKWMNQLARAEDVTFSALKLVAATLNSSAVRYSIFHSQPGVNIVSLLEEIEDLMNSALQPLLYSSNFKLICSRIKSSSCLLSKKRSGRDRDPPSLPSLGAVLWGGREVIPSINPTSPLAFLQALAHFLASVCSLHRGIHLQSIQNFLDNPHILEYIAELGNHKLQSVDSWFTRVETTMLADMLKLLKVVLPATNFQHVGLFHSMALRLVAVIPADEKHLAKEIFSYAVFNTDFFSDCSDVAYSLEALKLTDMASEQEKVSVHTLLEKATSKIPNLWNCYQTSLHLDAVSKPCPLDISSQTAGENGLTQGFPSDWPYLPILMLYNQALSGKTDNSNNTERVVSSLQWLLIVECLRPQTMATLSVTARFCRLSTVFLAGSDLFLEPVVHHHLEVLLRILLRSNSLLDFSEKISGITSFYDLYTQLVEQFTAVSYGDELFGHFVLVPLQQRHSPSYRKLVWSEHAAILRVLRTPPQKLGVPFQAYLEPCETDPSLLMCYLRGLGTGQVRDVWCPVLYRVALHHVATFIAEQPDTLIAQQLSSRIQQLGNKELQNKLFTYSKPEES